MQKEPLNQHNLDDLISLLDPNLQESPSDDVNHQNLLKSDSFTTLINKLYQMFPIVQKQSTKESSAYEFPMFMFNFISLLLFFFLGTLIFNVSNTESRSFIISLFIFVSNIFIFISSILSVYTFSFFINSSLESFNAKVKISKFNISHIKKIIKFKSRYTFIPEQDSFEKFFSKFLFKTRVTVNQSALRTAKEEALSFYYPEKNQQKFIELIEYFRTQKDYLSEKKSSLSKLKLPFNLGKYGIYLTSIHSLGLLTSTLLLKGSLLNLILNFSSTILIFLYLMFFNILAFKAQPFFNMDFEEKRNELEQFIQNSYEPDFIKLGLFSEPDFFNKTHFSTDEMISRLQSLSDDDFDKLISLIETDKSLFLYK